MKNQFIAKDWNLPDLHFKEYEQDHEINHLPTQYLSALIIAMGLDGIEYQSSMLKDGYNLAIFKSSKFECIEASVYDAGNI